MENGEEVETGVVRSVGMENGGEDVLSDKESDFSSADLLLVMVHGSVGRASLEIWRRAICQDASC